MAAAVLSPFFLALLTVFKIHFLPGLGIEGSRKYRKVQKSSFRFSGKEKRSFSYYINFAEPVQFYFCYFLPEKYGFTELLRSLYFPHISACFSV